MLFASKRKCHKLLHFSTKKVILPRVLGSLIYLELPCLWRWICGLIWRSGLVAQSRIPVLLSSSGGASLRSKWIDANFYSPISLSENDQRSFIFHVFLQQLKHDAVSECLSEWNMPTQPNPSGAKNPGHCNIGHWVWVISP